MDKFKEIKTSDMEGNVFKAIGRDWLLITAGKNGKANTMTASWGGFGVLWDMDVVYIFVRKSRYTKEFIDGSDGFSVSMLDPGKYRKEQAYLGKVSGRDEDKIAKAGLTVSFENGTPYFTEADTAVICRKVGRFEIGADGMLEPEIGKMWYANKDYHDMYIGKIEKVLVKD